MDNNKIIFSRRSKYPNVNINSRSGSMLVLVLIILAVSIILITSALMISTAGRQRYYKDAEREQASLTAMSAAKLIGQAAAKGNINKDVLKTLADNKATIQVSSSGLFPGLSEGNTNSSTYATFGYYPLIEKTYISVKVTTTLNVGVSGAASTESATVLLEPVIIHSSAFNNLITIGIESAVPTDNTFFKLDVGHLSSTDNAPVVVHGNVKIGADSGSGQQVINTDIIFTGRLNIGSGTTFNKNVIFSGDNASIETQGTGHSLSVDLGSVFFLRDSYDTVFTNYGEPAWENKTNIDLHIGGIYLLNSAFPAKESDIQQLPMGIVVGSNSTAIPAGRIATNATIIQNLTDQANLIATNIQGSVLRKVLSTSDVLNANPQLFQYSTNSQITTNAIEITAAQLADITLPYITFGKGAMNGNYYISLTTNQEIVKKKLIFDLKDGPITLYLIDNTAALYANKLEINDGSINFINGSPTRVGKIVLLNGADITIGPNNSATTVGIYGRLNTTDNTLETSPATNTLSAAPFLYLYGLGEGGFSNPNVIYIKNGELQGYIGLYGTDGRLIIDSAPSLFSRYEAAYIENLGSQDTTFLNCPAPPSDQGGGIDTVTFTVAGFM